MSSMIGRSGLAAAALCATWLAGCDAVRDVRDEPSTALPPQTVVLEGKVYGLGIRRSITVRNGTAAESPQRVVQGFPGEAVGSRGRESTFSFGSLADGTSYNIVVPAGLTPYGKNCVVNNGTGVLHYNASDPNLGSPQNIEVVCTNLPETTVPRFDVRVATPEPFRSALGSRVTLTTEEGIFTANPKDTADGDPNYVWFRDALITMPATGVLPFQNIVKAYTEEGSTAQLKLVNRCAVTNHTWPSPQASGAGDVTNVAVGACRFTVGGNDTVPIKVQDSDDMNPASGGAVRYSLPVGVTTAPAMGAGGLILELRYPNGDAIPSATGPRTEVTITSFGGSFTFPTQVTSGAECPLPQPGVSPVPCQVRGFYEVVVRQHPAGQRCIVGSTTVGTKSPLVGLNDLSAPNAGTAITGTTNYTATNTANNNYGASANLYILDESIAKGTFPISPADFAGLRVYCRNMPAPAAALKGTYHSTRNGGFVWSPIASARREYSHGLTLFDDGTFIFSAQSLGDATNSIGAANHTEYGFYQYATGTVADANNRVGGNKIRFTIHVDTQSSTTATAPLGVGLSGAEGPRNVGTGAAAVRHQVMTDVVLGTVPGTARPTITGNFGPDGSTATTTVRQMVFAEPESIRNQLTGPWVSQDRQRYFWFYGESSLMFAAGVNGGFANIQANCLKMDDITAISGTFLVPVGIGCSPLVGSVAHSPAPLLQLRLPGWRGWLPGSVLSEGVSPSPVYFQIAPAATFTSIADSTIFSPAPEAPTSWCNRDIVGLRETVNGQVTADRKPIYFCRNTAAP